MNAKAQKRAELIMMVRSGQMTATDAAQALGISRQQYYQWEHRGLSGMMSALEDLSAGRPKNPTDPEKEQLLRRVKELEQQIQHHQQRDQLRQVLKEWEQRTDLPPAKKKPK